MNTTACTMPTAERPLRLAEFDALFADAVRSVAYENDRVRDLAERETACCSFFSFVVDGESDDLTLEVSVPPQHRDILKALAARAVEQSA